MRIHEWHAHGIGAELVHADAGAALVGHTHDLPHALVVLDGVVTDDGRPYAARDVRMSPAGDPHFVRFQTACTCLVIFSADGALPIVTERRSGTLPSAGDARVRSLLGRDAGRAPTRGDLDGLVDDVLEALRDVGSLYGGPPAWLRELRCHVAVGREAGADTRRIARRAGVSREHLSRSFQRHYGTSFVTFRRHQRVAAACRLMRATVWPLAEVACAAGFADQSHMTRAFADCLGTTPGAFRAWHRCGRSHAFNPAPGRNR